MNLVRPIKDYPGIAEHIDGVLIVKVEEALYFANTGQLKDRLHRLEVFGDMSVHPSEEARLNPVSHVIFDVENMPSLDARYSVKGSNLGCRLFMPQYVMDANIFGFWSLLP